MPLDPNYPHIAVKIVADSVSAETQVRLTTFELTYPRYIHAEVMTHRNFSRNAQSSRAIPVKRRLENVRTNPVKPIRWGKNQAGMQAKDEDVAHPDFCQSDWQAAAHFAALKAGDLAEKGLHKQWANRGLEPYDTITAIVTATDYENFFALRCHPCAMDEFQVLAWKMADLYYEFRAKHQRNEGEWHLPYVSCQEYDDIIRSGTISGDPSAAGDIAVKASVARCARVSYLNHDGSNPDLEKDVALHDRLLADGHMSPFEHQARVDRRGMCRGGNFTGWTQYRKLLPGERRTFNYEEAKAKYRPW